MISIQDLSKKEYKKKIIVKSKLNPHQKTTLKPEEIQAEIEELLQKIQ